MKSLMRKFNLTLSSYEKIDTDGGSIIFYINKSERSNVIDDHISYDDLIGFKDYIEVRKHNIHKYLQNFHKDEIIGFGAGGKGQHLIHLLGLDMYCNKVLDNLNTNKNQYIPGTKIEIVSEDEINNPNLKLVLNLAPTHSKILKSKTPDRVIFYNIVEEEDKYFV